MGTSTPPAEGAWSRRLRAGFDRSIKVSDWASEWANAASAKVGGERFWPKSNDMPIEIEKCERILRAFTVEGIPQKEEKEEKIQDGKGNWITKKRKVFRKIPPQAIKNAKGIAIYSSMRSGIAPFGGGGGTGLVLCRLADGSWSAPAAVTPNNVSAGLLLGIDFLDVVLLINSSEALEGFMSHKFTIGAETGLTAGPYGAGTSAESGLNKSNRAAIYSYVRTRGMYAGVELMGQAFLSRFDENERFYYWPGITARDILTGKVRMPPIAYPLHRALVDAESGVAQGGKLDTVLYDIVQMPESEVMKMLGPNKPKSGKRFVAGGSSASPSAPSTPRVPDGEKEEEGEEILKEFDVQELNIPDQDDDDDELVKEGEKLKLPPTPQELEMLERAGIPDEDDVKLEQEERIKIYKLPPPPMHLHVQRYWKVRPESAAKRPTDQLVMDGPHSAEIREAQFVRLPPSPRTSMELREEAQARLREKEAAENAFEEDEENAQFAEDGEGVLLQGVEEKEADKVMQAAAEGEDVVRMKESGEMDQMVTDMTKEREEEPAQVNEETPDQQDDKMDNEESGFDKEEVVVVAAEEGASEEIAKMEEHTEAAISSSSRPSLNLSNGHDFDSDTPSQSDDNHKPRRPPRSNRAPRAKKT